MGSRSSKAVWGAVLALALWWPSAATARPRQAPILEKTLAGARTLGEQAAVIWMKPGHEAPVQNRVSALGTVSEGAL